MKFSVLATIIASTTAQITIVRPDKTTGVINSAVGCYGIYPTVAEVTNANGFKLEFYEDWNCKGKKVDDSVGNKVFPSPVKALSIKVLPNSRARYLREHKERKSRSRTRYLLEDNQARGYQDYENGYKTTESHSNDYHNSYETDQEAEDDYIPEGEEQEGSISSEDLSNTFPEDCDFITGNLDGCGNYTVEDFLNWIKA